MFAPSVSRDVFCTTFAPERRIPLSKRACKKGLRITLLSTLAFAFMGCEKMQELPEATIAEKRNEQFSPQRSQAEAIQLAQTFWGRKRSRRHAENFTVEFVLSDKQKTRGGDSIQELLVDTLLYALNRPNNQGFFLLSGDKRVDKVLAASPQGNLHLGALPTGSGLNVFMDRLPEYYIERIRDRKRRGNRDDEDQDPRLLPIEEEPTPDDLNPEYPTDPPHVSYGDWKEVERVGPLLKIAWHQHEPYNQKAPYIEGERATAGCVTIATAQLLLHLWARKEYFGPDPAYEFMTRGLDERSYIGDDSIAYNEMVSAFVQNIANQLGLTWGRSETSGSSYTAMALLRVMKIRNVPAFRNYSYDETVSSLRNQRPVYARGCTGKRQRKWWFITQGTEYTGGHAKRRE